MRKILSSISIVAIVVIGGFAIFKFLILPHLQENKVDIQPKATQALFAAAFPDVQGQSQALKQWQGKIVVVNFWASWCPPCLEEMPELSKFNEDYQAKNVIVLGITTDDLEKMQAFAKNNHVSYPLLAADLEAANLSETLGNDKGVLPYTVIINTDGNVAKSYLGRINRKMLDESVGRMLAVKNH